MKKISAAVISVLLMASVSAIAQTVTGGGYYIPVIPVNSASAPGTNEFFGPATNGYYAINIHGGDIVTNFAAKADVSAYKEISVQVAGYSDVSVGAVTGQKVVVTLYRTLGGGVYPSTNSVGTGMQYDTLGTITLPVTSSTTGPWTVISNFCNSSISSSPLAGVPIVIVGKIDASALTNAVSFTNYTVRIYGK